MKTPSLPPIVASPNLVRTVALSLPTNAGVPELAWALVSAGHLSAPLSPTHLARLTRREYATEWPDTPPANGPTYQIEICDLQNNAVSAPDINRSRAGLAGTYDCALDALWHAIHGSADPATFGFAPEPRELAVAMDPADRYAWAMYFQEWETPVHVVATARSAGLSHRDLQVRQAGFPDVLDDMVAMMDRASTGEE